MKAMILAAGLGTRLRPYSLNRPKPLFPVLDTPLILHTIKQLRFFGIEEILVNCHHLKNQIVDLVSREPGVFVQEEEKILGTGGGLRKAVQFFGEDPFLVVNGDIFHTIDIKEVIDNHLQSGASASLVLHDYPRFNSVTVGKNGLVRSFTDKGVYGKRLAFTGIHVVDPFLLSIIPENRFSHIIDIYSSWINKGKSIAGIQVSNHYWADIGTPEDYLDLHASLLKKKRFNASNSFHIGENVTIADDVVLSDWVSIGSHSTIGSGVSLKRVVVWDGCMVADGTKISDAILV